MKLVIDGETGSGKTYFAINKAKEIGSFIYVAPCRQLVYETAIKYGTPKDTITTGEVKITGQENIYAIYESLNHIDLNAFNTLIIDEAHFLTDCERSNILLEAIDKFTGNIFLVSATRNFKIPKGYKLIKLKALQKFKKKRITESKFLDRVKAGEPSIIFHKYKGACGNYGGYEIHADTPADERLQLQIEFAKGDITLIETTNVLAQGLNFPATNIMIVYNEWDTDEVIIQKIGRLGRYGIHSENQELTYCLSYKPTKISKKEIKKNEKKDNNLDETAFKAVIKEEYRDEILEDLRRLPRHEVNFSFYHNKNTDQYIFNYISINKYNVKTFKRILSYLNKMSVNDYCLHEVEEYDRIAKRIEALIKKNMSV
jgi:superfamily II DNA or RNA helicase